MKISLNELTNEQLFRLVKDTCPSSDEIKRIHSVLAEKNLGLVRREFCNHPFRLQEDINSYGMMGLLKAINSYDCDHGTMFSTYAVTCIKTEINYGLRREGVYRKNTLAVVKDRIARPNRGVVDREFVDKTSDTIDLAGAIRLAELDERETRIMELRFGLNNSPRLTLVQVGEVVGLTRQGVLDVQNKVLERLRKIIAVRQLV